MLTIKDIKEAALSVEEINELMKDWFVRDSETFTAIPLDIVRLGWEKEVVKGDAYSTFLYEDADDCMIKAVTIGRNLLVSMDLPKGFRLLVKPDPTSYTDGVTVVVSSSVFDDKTIVDTSEALDIYLGLVIHEGCHLKYTDFEVYRKKKPNKIVSFINNILEDERIERALGYDAPGLVRFLEKTKDYYFDHLFLADTVEDIESIESIEDVKKLGMRILNLLLRIIRYPKYLSEEDIKFFSVFLVEIKDTITPYSTDTSECLEHSEAIYTIIKDLLEDLIEPLESDKSTEESLKEILDALEEFAGDMSASIGAEKTSEGDSESVEVKEGVSKIVDDLISGKVEKSTDKHYFHKTVVDKDAYNDVLYKVRRYIPAIRKAIMYNDKEYKIVHKGTRSGFLDTSKLVEARQGVPTVYERHGEVKSDKVAICILVDLSGSMGGSKIKAAKEAAILLLESLIGNRSIELFVFGHTADMTSPYKADIHVYYEPGFDNKYTLGSIRAMSQNRDGDAIRLAYKRVRKKSSRKCLMFVIADGEPAAASYGGRSGISDTRQAVKEAERNNFDIVNIAIDSSYDPKEMYKHYIKLTELSSLPLKLGTLIKKHILKKQKISTT